MRGEGVGGRVVAQDEDQKEELNSQRKSRRRPHLRRGPLDRGVGLCNTHTSTLRTRNSGQQHIKHPNPFAPTQNKPPTAGFVELVDER